VPFRIRSAVLPLALAVLATGCPKGKSSGGSSVGTVLSVSPAALVGGATAAAGDPLPAQSLVSTNGTGHADFKLNTKFTDCRLDVASSVQVSPPGGDLLAFKGGTTWCNTDTDIDFDVTVDSAQTSITVVDPVFGVTVLEDRTIVAVAQGFVLVSTPGGEGSVLVGPNQESQVLEGQSPLPPVGFMPSDFEAQAIKDLSASVPPPNFGPPEAGDSPTLMRIFGDLTLAAAFDEKQVQDEGTEDFSHDFVSFLGESWGLKPALEPTSFAVAARALADGFFDVVLSPETSTDLGSLQLFQDSGGRDWFLSFAAGDPTLEEALRDFVAAMLGSGDYGRIYQEDFGAQPNYEPFRSLIGL